jgi:hypothetical protein
MVGRHCRCDSDHRTFASLRVYGRNGVTLPEVMLGHVTRQRKRTPPVQQAERAGNPARLYDVR